jgi:hypothetical protein
MIKIGDLSILGTIGGFWKTPFSILDCEIFIFVFASLFNFFFSVGGRAFEVNQTDEAKKYLHMDIYNCR